MEDLKDSIVNAVKERLNSSIFVNFCISWLIINWQATTFLIFIDKSKIEYYELPIILKSHVKNSGYGFWYPILTSLALAIIIPFLNSIIVFIKKSIYKQRDLLLETKVIGIDSVPGTYYMNLVDEKNELEQDYNQAIIDYKSALKKLSDLDNSVKALNLDLSNKSNDYNNQIAENTLLENKINVLTSDYAKLQKEKELLIENIVKIELLPKINYAGEIKEINDFEFNNLIYGKIEYLAFMSDWENPGVDFEIKNEVVVLKHSSYTPKLSLDKDEIFGILHGENEEKLAFQTISKAHFTIFIFINFKTGIKSTFVGQKLNLNF